MDQWRRLDFGRFILGIDCGTKSLGLCLMAGDGAVRHTRRLKSNRPTILGRIEEIHSQFADYLEQLYTENLTPLVAIEDGIFAMKIPNAAMVQGALGEIRGVVMAECWRSGLQVTKVAVGSWKAMLSGTEKAMPKNGTYVRYWNQRLNLDCTSPDEVDAVMIASAGSRR
jgi:Holliday junction resolvasome RuvABC endonuclease subunit